MIRKITKNNHQFKVSIPIEMLRKMNWDGSTEVLFQEVDTPKGKGLVMIANKEEVMKLR